MIRLDNSITTNHRKSGKKVRVVKSGKSGKSKYDRKVTELDVVTTRIRYGVNRVLDSRLLGGQMP